VNTVEDSSKEIRKAYTILKFTEFKNA
jgi:hypothetical protein